MAIRKSVTEDGTSCKISDSPNAICVQGRCIVRYHSLNFTPIVSYITELQSVGCDNVLESGAHRDSCGMCNGDDSGATRVNDTLTGTGGFGYHTITVISAGACNVRIAEVTVAPYVYIGKLL